MKINFYLQNLTLKESIVMCRVYILEGRMVASTSVILPTDKWNNKTMEVRAEKNTDLRKLNDRLLKYRTRITDIVEHYRYHNKYLRAGMLRQELINIRKYNGGTPVEALHR